MQSHNDEHAVFEITHIRQVAEDCYNIVSSEGPSFFIRSVYLEHAEADALHDGQILSIEEASDLISAGFCCEAERYASYLLNRCEQSRFGLTHKLQKKGFSSEICAKSLDYLEDKNMLSDSRYAVSWARSRIKSKGESKSRIRLELLSRGINKDVAEEALEEVYSAVDENMLLKKAAEKYRSRGYSEEKLIKRLVAMGFPFKSVKSMINEK
ncbi:MAG TPA: regulatory protein RecX [Treponemataceae bacterium]|nr:regulatory protein RecX [Treponemataceae bacterium]HQL04498.1 regulatory protein RecX [Treponemataceae bacterium]